MLPPIALQAAWSNQNKTNTKLKHKTLTYNNLNAKPLASCCAIVPLELIRPKATVLTLYHTVHKCFQIVHKGHHNTARIPEPKSLNQNDPAMNPKHTRHKTNDKIRCVKIAWYHLLGCLGSCWGYVAAILELCGALSSTYSPNIEHTYLIEMLKSLSLCPRRARMHIPKTARSSDIAFTHIIEIIKSFSLNPCRPKMHQP